jgi:hypothetical protein
MVLSPYQLLEPFDDRMFDQRNLRALFLQSDRSVGRKRRRETALRGCAMAR